MLSATLLAREALAAVGTDVVSDVKMSSPDVALQVELRIIVFGTVRIETDVLVRVHFDGTFWPDLPALARQNTLIDQ